ncbi:hypothetical protein [Shewanella indica]|uniref:hypothetical protein n=1 Tax=Shewanella indica TaxID=768528 RepID=UPI002043D8F7|nr:hypothetical protein [Shewanella indica]
MNNKTKTRLALLLLLLLAFPATATATLNNQQPHQPLFQTIKETPTDHEHAFE